MAYTSVGSIEPDPMIERILLLKQEAYVYKIPPAQVPSDESTGWIAKGWNLDKPETIKLKLVSKGTNCTLKLGEKYVVNIDTFPGPMVQTVSDSSRYFVINPTEGPHLGLGFADRSDSFDFNMALSDHFKGLRVDFEIAKEEEEPRELLDLSLKEGQTIKVNINIPLKNKRERSKSPAVAAGKNKPVVLPPPSAAAMAAGILPPGGAAANPFASQAPKLSAPPIKPANQSWIKF